MSLREFFLKRLNRLTGIPVEELDEKKLRQIRRELPTRPVVRENLGAASVDYTRPQGLKKLLTLNEIMARRKRVQEWLDSY